MANPKTELLVENEERPARNANGHVLANPAYHCRPEDLWPSDVEDLKPEWRDAIERYLFAFARPVRTIADEIRCVACDRQVTGAHVGLADFRTKTALSYVKEGTWEGRCAACAYPARLKHNIFMPDNGPCLVSLTGFPLFYHPESTVDRAAQIN